MTGAAGLDPPFTGVLTAPRSHDRLDAVLAPLTGDQASGLSDDDDRTGGAGRPPGTRHRSVSGA